MLPKGLWRKHTANGSTSNALIPATLTDLGGGALQRRSRGSLAGMKRIIFAFAITLAACGGKSKPAEPEPTPTEQAGDDCGIDPAVGTPATAEQCECKGLTVVGDIGDGQVACPEGSTEVSKISYGIEGGVCCQPPG